MNFFYKYSKLSAVFFLVLFMFLKSQSQDSLTNATEKKKQDTSQAGKPVVNKPPVLSVGKQSSKVIDVYKEGHADPTDKNRYKAGIGDIIVIRISNPKMLENASRCKTVSGGDSSAGCVQQEIKLFINGRMIKNITPISGA